MGIQNWLKLQVLRSVFDLTRVLKPFLAMVMYSMTDLQYQAVYNVLSFSLASMSATTMYLWFRASAVHIEAKGPRTEEPCFAYCNEDPRRIAADVRYPDPFLPFLEETVTYVCYNFYGDGTNFETFCKTDYFNERCYKKPCVGGTTTTTTCVLDDLVFLDNGCCRFNTLTLSQSSTGGHIEPKGAQAEEACLAYCNEDPRCI